MLRKHVMSAVHRTWLSDGFPDDFTHVFPKRGEILGFAKHYDFHEAQKFKFQLECLSFLVYYMIHICLENVYALGTITHWASLGDTAQKKKHRRVCRLNMLKYAHISSWPHYLIGRSCAHRLLEDALLSASASRGGIASFYGFHRFSTNSQVQDSILVDVKSSASFWLVTSFYKLHFLQMRLTWLCFSSRVRGSMQPGISEWPVRDSGGIVL